MGTSFISLTEPAPAGFESRQPSDPDLRQKRIVIWADSLEDTQLLRDQIPATVPCLTITPGANISHRLIGTQAWHLIVPAAFLPELCDLARCFLDMLSESQAALKQSSERFKRLFDASAISIWNEDLSAVCAALDKLRHAGVIDLRQHLQQHQQLAWELAALVKVVQVNRATLKLFGAATEADFINKIDTTFGAETIAVFTDELCAIWDKRKSFLAETEYRTLAGDEFSALISMQIPDTAAGFRSIPVSIIDISERKLTEAALQQSEERFREFVEGTDNLITQVDHQGNFLYVNHVAETIYGLSPQACIGQSAFQFIDPRDRDRTRDWFADCLQQQLTSASIENRQLNRSGQCHDMIWTVNFHYDQQGQIEHINGIARDISERKQSEEALRAERTRSHNILQGTNAGTWDWDTKTGELSINQRWAEIIGYSLAELGPISIQTWADSVHPDDLPECTAQIDQLLAGDLDHYDAAFRQQHKNGDWIWVNARGKVVERAADGKSLRISGTHLDISKLKQTELERRKLRNYLSSIIDSMPSVLIGVDTQGRVTQWNSEAQRITGIAVKEALGQPLAEVFPWLAPELGRVRAAIQTGQQQTDAKRPLQRNGETRFADVTIYPLRADGIEGAVIRVDDVTEKIRLEELLVQGEKMLSVGGLAAGMAHEINNPLAGMMQSAAVLRSRLTTAMPANQTAAAAAGTSMAAIHRFMDARNIPTMLETIQQSGDRVAKIVTTMLNFARKDDNARSSHDLTELLDRSLDLAGSDYDLSRQYDFRQIEILRDYQAKLPLVPCDPGTIQQVFLNILRNGAEAMQEIIGKQHPAQFRLRVTHAQASRMVQIEIEDNGPGMTEATGKRIFEPFFTTKPVGIGTGLGLSVSYFIIHENHAGEITVTSRPGQGTTFTIRLPLGSKPQADAGQG